MDEYTAAPDQRETDKSYRDVATDRLVKQQQEEFPLGSQAIGLCSTPRCRSRRVEEHKLSICAAPIRQKSANRSYLLRVFISKNRAELLGQNEPREEE